MNEDQLRTHVGKLTKSCETNSDAAKMVGCSRPQFVNFMAGRKPPSKNMLRKLKLRREWTYIPKVAEKK